MSDPQNEGVPSGISAIYRPAVQEHHRLTVDQARTVQRRRFGLGGGAIVAAALMVAGHWFLGGNWQFAAYVLAFLVTVRALLSLVEAPTVVEPYLSILDDEIDLAAHQSTTAEQNAYRVFRSHQRELKRYYDQTLRHSSWAFATGVACVMLGFLIVAIALYLIASQSRADERSANILMAALAAIGAILSNYIAAIYLRISAETAKSLSEFHNRLVATHHLHYGAYLAAKIRTESIREKALSEMAISTSRLPPSRGGQQGGDDKPEQDKTSGQGTPKSAPGGPEAE